MLLAVKLSFSSLSSIGLLSCLAGTISVVNFITRTSDFVTWVHSSCHRNLNIVFTA